jgi:uncharacterized membrane protein
MKTAVSTLILATTLVLVDGIYLNLIKNYFGNQIQLVQGSPMRLNLTATILVYIFVVCQVQYFIIQKRASVSDAFLLGILTYGIFELTNMALFKNWKAMSVIIDTLWGGILYAVATYVVYKLHKYF